MEIITKCLLGAPLSLGNLTRSDRTISTAMSNGATTWPPMAAKTPATESNPPLLQPLVQSQISSGMLPPGSSGGRMIWMARLPSSAFAS
ncbi:MAG: hypothetical protein GY696_08105 [Gammaproteobacteria bacterium]|nr:hypothetical protein [Gammaproteobacteria bacterium]